MVEYIAKNLAIELMHQSSYLSDGDLLEVNGNLAKARIEAEPAADVVPVVRCKNCKHLANRDEEGGKCWRGSGFARAVKNDDFCSYGERKEEYEAD